MNMKQFKYVLVLANERSISRAAENLGITQPSLSQYLKKIETEVGARLFDRNGTEIRITDAGRAYIDAGRKILDIEHQMEGRIADINNNVKGSIIIGISPYRTTGLMPEVIRRFSAIYPGFKVSLVERSGKDLLDGAEHGEYDLCITTAPIDENLFLYEKIMDEEVVLAVPENKVFESVTADDRKYKTVDISLLNGERIITLSDDQIMQRMLDDLCKKHGITYNTSIVCTSINAQIAMVREGLGVALVPSGIRNNTGKGIEYYSIKQELPLRKIVAAYRKGQYISKPIKDLIEVLKGLEA